MIQNRKQVFEKQDLLMMLILFTCFSFFYFAKYKIGLLWMPEVIFPW